MLYTLKLLSLVVLGTIAGAWIKKAEAKKEADWSKLFFWTGKVQTVAVVFLIFVLGLEIGADPQVFESLGTIGIAALVITAAGMSGGVLLMHLLRRALKFDREGVKTDD